MKMRKMAAAALAAVIAAGSVSAVSFAETDEIREDSKYEITLEKEIVDGEEKAAVIFKGLPKEALTFDYSHVDESTFIYEGKQAVTHNDFSLASIINVIIGESENGLHFQYYCEDEEFKWRCGVGGDWHKYSVTVDEAETTLTLKAYLDFNDVNIKNLSSEEKTVVNTYAYLNGWCISCYDGDGDGHMSEGEQNHWISTGDAGEYVPIYSNEKIALHTSEKWNATAKERVKITNNLNAPAESDPTESTGVPGDTDKTSDSEDKQETIDVTLKNVDSKNGIEGEALDKLLFGDSGWTWGQVEKIEFTSDKLFSVQYTAADGSTKTLSEQTAARAEDDGIWNTAWTLDTSLMSKEKPFVKLIAKDGTADITAKVYIKMNAEKPSNSDQKPTGIALAIAPVVLAAGAVIVISKKRK